MLTYLPDMFFIIFFFCIPDLSSIYLAFFFCFFTPSIALFLSLIIIILIFISIFVESFGREGMVFSALNTRPWMVSIVVLLFSVYDGWYYFVPFHPESVSLFVPGTRQHCLPAHFGLGQ